MKISVSDLYRPNFCLDCFSRWINAVISIAALCLALKLPYPLMAALANLGGGIVCEYTGVVPIDAQRLLREATQYLTL